LSGSAVTPSKLPEISTVSLSLLFAQPLSHPSSDIHVLLEAEKELTRGRNRYLELFTIPRNRRASLASGVVMFM
jgi:hypothetical protein